MKATLRGNEVKEVQSHSKRALYYLDLGEKAKASETVKDALQLIAAPLNDLAWVLLKSENEIQLASLLSRLSVSIKPQDPNFLHTMAEIQYKIDGKQEALKTLERAQAIKPIFTEQLKKWRSEIANERK